MIPVAAIIPSLKSLLIMTTFSSFHIPTALVLFVSSPPIARRQLSFVIIPALTFGLTKACSKIYVIVSEYLPASPSAYGGVYVHAL